MIVATVGTQLPFPRMLNSLDTFAARHSLKIFAQTADPSWAPRHMEAVPFLPPSEFARRLEQAEVIVGHAGIGTVLAAQKYEKPVILFPRRGSLNEHRNDHQIATARFLCDLPGCHVAWDENALESLILAPDLESASQRGSARRDELLQKIHKLIVAS